MLCLTLDAVPDVEKRNIQLGDLIPLPPPHRQSSSLLSSIVPSSLGPPRFRLSSPAHISSTLDASTVDWLAPDDRGWFSKFVESGARFFKRLVSSKEQKIAMDLQQELKSRQEALQRTLAMGKARVALLHSMSPVETIKAVANLFPSACNQVFL